VVTDRVLLDAQIKDTIKSFMQVGSTVVHAEHSGDLRHTSWKLRCPFCEREFPQEASPRIEE